MCLASRLRHPPLYNELRVWLWRPPQPHSNSDDQQHDQTARRHLRVRLLPSHTGGSAWMQAARERSQHSVVVVDEGWMWKVSTFSISRFYWEFCLWGIESEVTFAHDIHYEQVRDILINKYHTLYIRKKKYSNTDQSCYKYVRLRRKNKIFLISLCFIIGLIKITQKYN